MGVGRKVLERTLGRRLPTIDGALEVPGIDGEIAIRRDGYGVPHVTAGSDGDAAFGLGFCLGQDRTFQLEVLLRTVRGTLAELRGPAALPADRLSRRIGFRLGAEQQLTASDPAVQRWVEAYVRGLAAGADVGLPRRPHEFVLLRSRPTTWTVSDVVALWRLMAFLLAPKWSIELVRLKMALTDGIDAVLALDAPYPRDAPVVSPPGTRAGALVDRLAEDLDRFVEQVRIDGGSNAWVVAGDRTTTGRPLLANDPHLAPVVPAWWYLVHLRTPEWAVAGATFVGLGAIPVGHDGNAAWGITAGLVDNTDLVIERIDGDHVLDGDDWVPCERRIERIEVRGGEPVDEEVLITPNGPIVSPALAEAPCAISLRATWLAPEPADLVLLHRVGDLDGLRDLGSVWAGAALNVLWAERAGTIGWQLIGRPPLRSGQGGTFPVAGWDRDARWDGRLLPPEEMPWDRDPDAGYLVSANNPPHVDRTDRFGRDWLDGYRAGRIEERLAARDDWDVAAMARLQLDVTSNLWRDIADTVLTAPTPDPAAVVGQHLLADWDGRVTGDSPAASVFELFTNALYRRVVAARAPGTVRWALGEGLTALTPRNYFPKRRATLIARLLRDQPDGWLDRPWPDAVGDALSAAVRDLQQRFGEDPSGWAWGRVRPLVLRHTLGSRPALAAVFNLGPFPAGGDHETPSQHGVDAADPTRPAGVHPSLRVVLDPGAPEACRFALPGGQSGNPLSTHYRDQVPAYSSGRGIPIAWTEEEVRKATRATLHLLPAAPSTGPDPTGPVAPT